MAENDKVRKAAGLVPGSAVVALGALANFGPVALGALAYRIEQAEREAIRSAEFREWLAGLAAGIEVELGDLEWLDVPGVREAVRRLVGLDLSPEAIGGLGVDLQEKGGSDE